MYSLLSHHILLILVGLVMVTVVESQIIAQKCQSVYNWIHGPFVYNKDHNCDSLQGFMNSNILHNVSIINEILELDSDEPSTVIFEANQGLPFPMEIRWAEFRGNMKLIRLGDNSKSLVLHDGESNVQISSVGHLFVVMKPVNLINDNWFSLAANHEHVELITNINQIVGMYIVSSRDEMTVKLGLDQRAFLNVEELMRITGAVCADYLYQDTLISDTISNPNLKVCIKAMLLTYWEHQRLSQVPVYTWTVPTIPTVSSYTTTTTTNSDISYEYYSNDKNINKDSNNDTKDNINDVVSTRALWITKHLTDDFTHRIADWHRTHRGTDMSHPEPPISLVFNQLEAPTYYTPLSDELHQALVDEVHHMVADWLGVEKEGLEVTGAYSSREYRQGAVVRWHVDPVETQPITAIVHIGSSSGSRSRRRSCCCIHTTTTNYSDSCTVGTSTFTKNHHDYSYSASKEYSIQNSNIATEPQCTAYNYSSNHSKSSRSWLLQVPKSLTQFITYKISSQATAHISHNTTEHIYDPEMLYNINIQPGEVLLLQSSKLPHARLLPLQDEWYTNAFVHFRPKEWMHQDIIHSLLR